MARFTPSHRDPDALQPEFCEVCGCLRPRNRLVEMQVEGLKEVMACDLCLKGLKGPSFRDHLARSGRRPQLLPNRMPPYGASGTWFDEVLTEEE